MTTRFALLLTIILYAVAPAAADELRLANGDRLTGRVVSLTGGALAFSTAHGDLRIPWSSVVALSVEDPVLVTIAGGTPAPVTIQLSPDAGRAMLQPGGAIALTDISALARPEPPVIIDGGVNAGFVSSAGNTDTNSLRLDGDIVARAAANRYTMSAAVTRAEDRDVETARN